MLAAQMAATHLATMHFAVLVMAAETPEARESRERIFNRCARTYTTQAETLKRYRTGGEQKVTVQHQHISVADNAPSGGRQRHPGEGSGEKMSDDLVRPELRLLSALRCRAMSKRSGECCKGPAVRGWSVCRMHGARGGGPKGSRNGRYRHGQRTNDFVASRRAIKLLI